jgi:Mn2+/Fe2+ NRAMP family transporter
VLLPIMLFFVSRLSASEEVMGGYRNGPAFDAVARLAVAATSVLSLILLAVTVSGM